MRHILLVLLLIFSSNISAKSSRGIRNCNPGNLRSDSWRSWNGATGTDEEGYIIFRRKIDGLRAIVINLRAYRQKHGLVSVAGIINRWTRDLPPLSRREYIKFVCYRMGVSPWQKLDMEDPVVIKGLTRSIIAFENGSDPYSEKIYQTIFPTIILGPVPSPTPAIVIIPGFLVNK